MNIEKTIYQNINDDHTAIANAVTSSLTVGDFTGIYTPFSTESNWTNNLYTGTVIAGILGDKMYGEFETGAWGSIENTQYGWKRYYNNSKINLAKTLSQSIANALALASNWASSGFYTSTTAGFGDVGQWHSNGIYKYECIFNDGTNHIWMRTEASLGTPIVIPDVTYIPYYSLAASLTHNSSFVVPALSTVLMLIIETTDTLGGLIKIGTTLSGTDILGSDTIPVTSGVKKNLGMLIFLQPNIIAQTIYFTSTNSAVFKGHFMIQKCIS